MNRNTQNLPGVSGKTTGQTWINENALREQQKLKERPCDSDLFTTVIEALKNIIRTDSSSIKINVVNRTVFLFGEVESIEVKRAIENTVRNLSNVSGVNSNINVRQLS